MRSSYVTRAFLAVLALAASTVAMPAFAQAEDPIPAAVRKANEVKMAMGTTPGWVFMAPNGEAKGYPIEIIKLALTGMGCAGAQPRPDRLGGANSSADVQAGGHHLA